jgi:hypothetical protein
MKNHPKPRVNFCWHCGRKLYGRHHKVLLINYMYVTVHESCAEEVMKDPDYIKEEK